MLLKRKERGLGHQSQLFRFFLYLAIATIIICSTLYNVSSISQIPIPTIINNDFDVTKGLSYCNYTEHKKSTTVTTSVEGPKPPVSWRGTWVGNNWMPWSTYYKTYSPVEIGRYFAHLEQTQGQWERGGSILFVGDSTARRQYATFYALLSQGINGTTDLTIPSLDGSHVIDINKSGRITEKSAREGYDLYRPVPVPDLNGGANFTTERTSSNVTTTKFIGLRNEACLPDLVDMLRSAWFREELPSLSLVVFVIGPWEYDGRCFQNYPRSNITRQIFQIVQDEILNNSTLNENIRFVWRTWGGKETGKSTGPSARQPEWMKAQTHNVLVKNLIHNFQWEQWRKKHDNIKCLDNKKCATWNALTYVDWGMAMGPRLFPSDKRIHGDISNHFGLEARMAFIQQLTNHLVELDRQERSELAPWSVAIHSDEKQYGYNGVQGSFDDCETAGLSKEYCLTRDELAIYTQSFLVEYTPDYTTEEERVAIEEIKAKNAYCGKCLFAQKPPISCDGRVMYLRKRYNTPMVDAIKSVLGTEQKDSCNGTFSVEGKKE